MYQISIFVVREVFVKLVHCFAIIISLLVCSGCSPDKTPSPRSQEVVSSRNFALPKTKVGNLFILSGPSGTGKTTIAQIVLENLSNFKRAVTTTTRKPRVGEVDGVDYHFVSPEAFQEMMGKGEFLESVEQYGHAYGTTKKAVEEVLCQGSQVLLVIDTRGAKAIKTLMPEAVLIFLKPPSLQELEKRLTGRGSEDKESLARRLEKVHSELLDEKFFQYSVINDEVDRTYRVVSSIIIAECYRVAKN